MFFDSGFDFVPFFYFIEEIGIDCDGIDADWDSLIDDDCEVEDEIKAAGWWD